MVRTREAIPLPDPSATEPGPSRAWTSWLWAGAVGLVEAVRDSDGPMWTPFGSQPAIFWLRRMLSETVVHYADAALTAGVTVRIAPDLAADTLSEGLDLLADNSFVEARLPPGGLWGNGETLLLRTGGNEPGWQITRTQDGVAWKRADGDAVVQARSTCCCWWSPAGCRWTTPGCG